MGMHGSISLCGGGETKGIFLLTKEAEEKTMVLCFIFVAAIIIDSTSCL